MIRITPFTTSNYTSRSCSQQGGYAPLLPPQQQQQQYPKNGDRDRVDDRGGIRICANCRHARKLHPPYVNDLGCSLFKRVDVVKGNELLDLALDARNDPNSCGIEGRFFESVVEPIERLSRTDHDISPLPRPSPSSAYSTLENP